MTFRLHSCNAGKHRIAITYALASGDPPRPLEVQVNGGYQQQTVDFPATGSWTVWGKVFIEGMLLDGE